jgi:hypothetical protein
MRMVLLTIFAAALLLAGAPTAGGVTSDRAGPAIRIAQFSPLVVTGEHFRRTERVVLRVMVPERTYVRTLRTTRRGTFVARFESVTGDRCGGGLVVVATAGDGRTAKARMPQFLCPPAIP